ncbi:MAG: glycosyltransferase family 2 protein [Cellulophaga sp.]
MQDSLISILIPFKNTDKYLVECIDSIVSQTYKHWEIIAIDDHSTDTSWSIMESYEKRDSRISVFKNQGKGIIEALRKAYSISKGSFITRMDADDIMAPERIGVMHSSLLKSGTGNIAIGGVKYFAKDGVNDGYKRYEEWLNRLTKEGSNYSEIYKECVIPSPCWMMHKSDLDACDAFIPNRYPEDYDLAFRFYENKLKCIPSEKVLHFWRDYDNRTSRTSEHYAQNYFLDIKMHYFLKLDFNKQVPLVVWGAGKKGKTIAKKLLEKEIDFHWVCDNPNKIGKDIYGKKMLSFEILQSKKEWQCIVTVANVEEQLEIKNFIEKNKALVKIETFFFC